MPGINRALMVQRRGHLAAGSQMELRDGQSGEFGRVGEKGRRSHLLSSEAWRTMGISFPCFLEISDTPDARFSNLLFHFGFSQPSTPPPREDP